MKIKFMGLAFLNAAIVCGAQVNQGGHMNAYEKNTVFGCGTFPSDVPFVHMATQSYLKTKMIIKEYQSGTGFFPRCQYFPDDFFGINVQNNSDVCMDPWVLDEEDCSEGQESDNNKSYSASPKSYPEASEADTDESVNAVLMETLSPSYSELNTGTDDDFNEQKADGVALPRPEGQKLPPSKTSVFDSLVVCAIEGNGATLPSMVPDKSTYKISITDIHQLLKCLTNKCSRKKQAKNINARVKALKKMFTDWPNDALNIGPFDVHVVISTEPKNLGSARLKDLLQMYSPKS